MKYSFEEKYSAGVPIAMLTAYDYPTARLCVECGIDLLLVGDSLGTNVLGLQSVAEVTVADMVHHTKAVARAKKQGVGVVADMPYQSFSDATRAISNARKLVEAGADFVKMEGDETVIDTIEQVVRAGIGVVGHIGYIPQFHGDRARVQGKDVAAARTIADLARRMSASGVSLLVLELIPRQLSGYITRSISVPTIGIGAGRSCSGQVQVWYDIAGFSEKIFRHAHRFADAAALLGQAISGYSQAVQQRSFPTDENAFSIDEQILKEAFGDYA